MNHAYPSYCHPPKGDSQTLVYSVWIDRVFHFVWITVDLLWLRDQASLNDLKQLAIAKAKE